MTVNKYNDILDAYFDGDKITVNKYNDILDAYGLTQHISYATRHGKSLIDHISSSIPKKVICENVIPS